MKTVRTALCLAAALLLSGTAFAADSLKTEKSFPLDDEEHKVGIKFGDVTIDSVKLRNFPDPDDFEKAEKDHNDTHTVVVEFTYSNRDDDHDYKCKYHVIVDNGKEKDGKPWGDNDRTATLDKGKIDDTNKMFMKMKTLHFKEAKKFKVSFEVWKKS
jgi:hypothetical protein